MIPKHFLTKTATILAIQNKKTQIPAIFLRAVRKALVIYSMTAFQIEIQKFQTNVQPDITEKQQQYNQSIQPSSFERSEL